MRRMEDSAMQSSRPSEAAGSPVRRVGLSFPAALFVAALLTDLAYWRTADPQWSTMSSWLLLAGLVVGGIVVLVQLIRVLASPALRRLRPAWIYLVGDGLAVLLSILNFIFHVRDGYSAVVPAGPVLSAAVVLVLLFTGWIGRGLVRPQRVQAADIGALRTKEA